MCLVGNKPNPGEPKIKVWHEAEIKERSQYLADKAISIWKLLNGLQVE